MYILGLNLLHDTSATLIKNGEILGAVEEERFNGIKHTDLFPSKSIEWLLNQHNLNIEDVKVVTSYEFSKFKENINPFEENTIKQHQVTEKGRKQIVSKNKFLYDKINNSFYDNNIYDWEEVNHHLSHAAGGYFLSGFEEANVIVIDGRGEYHSTTIYFVKNGKFEKLSEYSIENSIGQLYTYVTELCSLYTSRGQEGKTMGLAAYGTYNKEMTDLFDEIIKYKSNKYYIDRNKMYELEKYRSETVNQIAKDLAYNLQLAYEKLLEFLVRTTIDMTGCKKLVMSGGVALNCNGNGSLLEKGLIDDLYIQPAANDGGTSLGAALYYYYSLEEYNNENCTVYENDVYLGPEFSDEQIEQILKVCGINYEVSESVERDTANLLAKGFTVGWFQGKMEFGPRALGNRSILADPRSIRMKDKVNNTVKFREDWRPFAPSILSEQSNQYFDNCKDTPHMTITYRAIKDKIDSVPSVIHRDGTARVQTVTLKTNEKYYKLIEEFYKITGVPVLLNTSFNGPEPIVMSPKSALKTFYTTGLDVLVIGNFIIKKQNYIKNKVDSKQVLQGV